MSSEVFPDSWQLPPLNYSDDSAWMTNSTDDDLSTSRTLADWALTQVMVPVVISVIAALGLVGNLSVIAVVIFQMRSAANTLIASLAVVDLLFCVICLPVIAVVYATDTWPFGDVWCKVCRLMILTSMI